MKTTVEKTELDWGKLSRIARKLARKSEDVAQSALLAALRTNPQTEDDAILAIRNNITQAWRKEKSKTTIVDLDDAIPAPQDRHDGAEFRHGLKPHLVKFVLRYLEDADGKLRTQATIKRTTRRVQKDNPKKTQAEISAVLASIERDAVRERLPEPQAKICNVTPRTVRTFQPIDIGLSREPGTEFDGLDCRTGKRVLRHDKPAPEIKDLQAYEQQQKQAASNEKDSPLVTTSKPVHPIRFYRGRKNAKRHARRAIAITSIVRAMDGAWSLPRPDGHYRQNYASYGNELDQIACRFYLGTN